MTTQEATPAVQQPEPVTMFRLVPGEGGGFDLALTTWTLEYGYERAEVHLSPRIASAFRAAVEREMADVPPPPALSRDDLMRIHREIGCDMSVDQPAATLDRHMRRLTLALAEACADPLDATVPYGEDDGIMRTLVLPDTLVVIYLGHQTKTLHIYGIEYAG